MVDDIGTYRRSEFNKFSSIAPSKYQCQETL